MGGAIFIRCFVDKQGIENQRTDKLGNGFSIAPFATVLVRLLQSQGPRQLNLNLNECYIGSVCGQNGFDPI